MSHRPSWSPDFAVSNAAVVKGQEREIESQMSPLSSTHQFRQHLSRDLTTTLKRYFIHLKKKISHLQQKFQASGYYWNKPHRKLRINFPLLQLYSAACYLWFVFARKQNFFNPIFPWLRFSEVGLIETYLPPGLVGPKHLHFSFSLMQERFCCVRMWSLSLKVTCMTLLLVWAFFVESLFCLPTSLWKQLEVGVAVHIWLPLF